mmetsp:Transcript_7755/g.22096  ORF Transcript_7755/g.22096 Transcript_7755/m.22096 type:complete len:193 (+) Transcript_7755:492-1070(+)
MAVLQRGTAEKGPMILRGDFKPLKAADDSDTEAKEALSALMGFMNQRAEKVELLPGGLLLVDNLYSMHGREEMKGANFSKDRMNERWLKRAFVACPEAVPFLKRTEGDKHPWRFDLSGSFPSPNALDPVTGDIPRTPATSTNNLQAETQTPGRPPVPAGARSSSRSGPSRRPPTIWRVGRGARAATAEAIMR